AAPGNQVTVPATRRPPPGLVPEHPGPEPRGASQVEAVDHDNELAVPVGLPYPLHALRISAQPRFSTANIRLCRCQLAFDWLISTRWPSGSRRKQRISEPQSCGGVRNAAPLDRSAS